MKKLKSEKNKTIDFELEDGKKYIDKCLDFSCINQNNKKSISKIADKNITILGDSFKVLNNIEPKSIDLLIADPFYNLSKSFHGNKFSKTSKEEYSKYTRGWIEKVVPLLSDNASIYICCDWESSMVIGNVLSEFFIVRNRITWQREKGRGAKTNWKNAMEDIWFATISDEYTFNVDAVKIRKKVIAPYKQDGKPKDWEETANGNFRNTHPSNFWNDITIPYWSMPENTAHPTQKPEKLVAKLILASSNVGDTVLDPFLGSGTTSVVAKKLDRQYLGIEQNPLYCAWAEYRLKKAENDKEIQGYKKGVFWERNSLNMQK